MLKSGSASLETCPLEGWVTATWAFLVLGTGRSAGSRLTKDSWRARINISHFTVTHPQGIFKTPFVIPAWIPFFSREFTDLATLAHSTHTDYLALGSRGSNPACAPAPLG